MSIATRIESMEDNIRNAYTSIESLGIDTSSTNKNIYNISTLLDTFYESLPKVSGIGASLSLSPSMVGKIKLNEIQGDTLQNGTPTPSSPVPIQSVTGLQNVEVCVKNLFDIDYMLESQYNASKGSTTGYNKSNDNIVSIGNYTSNGRRFLNHILLSSGTYTMSFNQTFSGTNKKLIYSVRNFTTLTDIVSATSLTGLEDNSKVSFSFTLNEETDIFISIQPDNSNGGALTLSNIQLELGSTATEYEPYTGNTYEVNLGKNLLDYSTMVDGNVTSTGTIFPNTSNGEMCSGFIQVKPNTKYTFKIFETSSTYDNWFGVGEYTSNNENSFIQRDTTNNVSQNYITFTTTATTNYVRLSGRNLKSATKVQFELGEATSYSPYFTPIELNKIGDYEDSIKKSTGKNLFDGIVEQGEFQVNGNINTSATTRKYSVDYIPVVPSENYVSNYNINRMCFYDSNKTFISRSTNYNFNTFTIPNNVYYIRFDISTDYNTNTLQIEQGSSSSPYEPYGKVWYVEKNVSKVVLDGSEDWNSWYNIGDNIGFYHGQSDGYGTPNEYAINNLGKCNRFTEATLRTDIVDGLVEKYKLCGGGNMYIAIGLTKTKLSDYSTKALAISSFKTWLSSNNTQVNYALKTPTYTTITNTELINQLESLNNAKSEDGTTNINVTSEDLSMILNVGVLKGDA